MCFKLSPKTAIENEMMENKSRLIKAVMNIIKKLNTTKGSKREKYMSQVQKEFKLAKDEKWVITKPRMIIVTLDARMELLQIRKPLTSEVGIQLVPRDKIKRKAQKAIQHNCKVFHEEGPKKNAPSEHSLKKSVLVKQQENKRFRMKK